jgi:hypothetical protein
VLCKGLRNTPGDVEDDARVNAGLEQAEEDAKLSLQVSPSVCTAEADRLPRAS